jgi:hypothetical protein
MVVRNAKTGKFAEIIAGDQLRKELVEGIPFAGFKVIAIVVGVLPAIVFACSSNACGVLGARRRKT